MDYKSKLECLGPVAIKLDQTEIHAPSHNEWRKVTCAKCGERFSVGPNRIYGSRTTETECVAELESSLAEDHRKERPHPNSLELKG